MPAAAKFGAAPHSGGPIPVGGSSSGASVAVVGEAAEVLAVKTRVVTAKAPQGQKVSPLGAFQHALAERPTPHGPLPVRPRALGSTSAVQLRLCTVAACVQAGHGVSCCVCMAWLQGCNTVCQQYTTG
jgi:hypothetical protein